MNSRFLRSLVAMVVSVVLLAGCFGNSETAETPKITNASALAAIEGVEVLSGNSIQKVEAYLQATQEAQAQLEILLSQQSGRNTSFLRIIPVASAAEDSTTTDAAAAADEIEMLLAEIQTYTELAAEAATEETNPETLADLLTSVQEAQVTTEEIVSAATTDATAEVASVLSAAAEEISSSITEVDAASAEVSDAIDSGSSEVQIEIDTEAGDFLADGATSINLRERVGEKMKAERKLRNAVKQMEKVKAKLIENGVPKEEADVVMAENQALVAQAQQALEAGDFSQAHQLAKDGKKGFQEIQVLVNRAKDAKARIPELKVLAEAGDAVAAAKLEKLIPLAQEGKDLKEKLQQRKEIQKEFRQEAVEIRAETKTEREARLGEFADLKLKEATGEISPEEFKQQQKNLFEQQQEIRANRFQEEKALREEKIQTIQELKDLPPQEAESKLTELEKQQKIQRRNILLDGEKLKEAIQTGDPAVVEATKQEIQTNRVEAKAKLEEKKEEFKIQNQEARKTIQDNRENIQGLKQEAPKAEEAIGDGLKKIKENIIEKTQQRVEDRKEILKEKREEVRQPEAQVNPVRKEILQEKREEGNKPAIQMNPEKREIKTEVKQPLPPKMPALENRGEGGGDQPVSNPPKKENSGGGMKPQR